MKCAEVLATIPAELIAKFQFPLSFRLLGNLGKLDEDERATVFAAAAQAPDAESARETLKVNTRRRNKVDLNDMDRVRRYTGAIEDWFADFHGEKEVMPFIRKLLTLAERLVAANQSGA